MALRDTPDAAEGAFAAAQEQFPAPPAAARIATALTLWRETPQAWSTIKQVLRLADHGQIGTDAKVGPAIFDEAAFVSAEASAALYSLGRSDLLDAAAHSIVSRLEAWGLTAPASLVLDLGCGSGRLLAVLAPRVRLAIGTDVSTGMLDAARRRCHGLTNVHLIQTDGRDLQIFADSTFDLVVAVDVFPYLVSCAGKLAARHFFEASRLLARGGSLLILNYSYRQDDSANAAEVTSLADDAGLQVVRTARNDFDLWDGRTFHVRHKQVSCRAFC